MEITSDMVSAYKGLQVRIHDLKERSMIQGPLKDAYIENGDLALEFEWLGKKSDVDVEWTTHPTQTFLRSMKGHAPKHVGVTNIEFKLSFCLPHACESITFLPRASVKNLSRERLRERAPSFVRIE